MPDLDGAYQQDAQKQRVAPARTLPLSVRPVPGTLGSAGGREGGVVQEDRVPSFSSRFPDGDRRERQVCNHCGFISYENPKVVVGAVCHWHDRVLLCRRSIEPQAGLWTLPAGFLEQRESPDEGARREAAEEANAEIRIDALLGVYSISRISQIQMIYRASLASPDVSAGEETLEVMLFAPDDIPWAQLAFPSVHWALFHDRQVAGVESFPPFLHSISSMTDIPPR